MVVGILVLSGLGAVALEIKTEPQTLLDELDQFQDVMTENAEVPIGHVAIPDNPISVQVAQSFIPTLPILTRLELFIGKNSTATYDLNVAIRDDLTGDDLTLIIIDPSAVPTETYDWVSIDFDDIPVTAGQTHYIVTYTENETDNFYAWGCNNESDSYVDGCAWFSLDDGGTWDNRSAASKPSNIYVKPRYGGTPIFDEYPTWDTCFRTYGKENAAPSTPDISGPTSGEVGTSYDYTFVSEDTNGDPVYYKINWGDGDVVEWFGPFDSEDPQTRGHTWDNPGEYTISIKAKDIWGEESSWGTLKVSMTKNRALNTRFLRFMQNYPHIFSILQRLLKY